MTNEEKVIDTAKNELGYKEDPAGSNKTKYGQWYGLDGVAWCAIFVSWVFDKSGIPLGYVDKPNGYQYCPSAYNYWRKKNEITHNPQPGDIVLFDWGGDNKMDHTGIFYKDNGNGKTFEALEGNTATGNDSNGGEVMQRTRYYNVAKFVHPSIYNGVPADNGPDTTVYVGNLKNGSKGAYVKTLQIALNDHGADPKLDPDGDFGNKTEKAVRAFQEKNGLGVDGVAGKNTYKALGVFQ
jgi:cell wall-associated NlpC family hydrolase